MKSLDVAKISRDDSAILWRAALLAVLLEFIVLTLIGIHDHWLAHPQKTVGLDETKFLEAEVYQIPKEAHLTEIKKNAAPLNKEVTLNKSFTAGHQKTAAESKTEEQNQTTNGQAMVANHGPVAVSAPPPIIPSYLQDKEISSSVLIEFLVNNQGQATPRLIGSSGNDELDAIALQAVKKWVFRPAEQDHRPIDAKIRLRINFDVQ